MGVIKKIKFIDNEQDYYISLFGPPLDIPTPDYWKSTDVITLRQRPNRQFLRPNMLGLKDAVIMEELRENSKN